MSYSIKPTAIVQMHSFNNIATIAGGTPVKNISLSLDDFSSSDGSLYEFAIDDSSGQPTLADDYADLLEVYVLSDDDMFGRIDIGGAEWWIDHIIGPTRVRQKRLQRAWELTISDCSEDLAKSRPTVLEFSSSSMTE